MKATAFAVVCCFVLVAPIGALPAQDTPPSGVDEFLDAMTGGKVKVNLRLRAEFADAETTASRNHSAQAYTSRLRLGYQSGEYKGLHLYADVEDIRAGDYNAYNAAGLNGQGTKTVIADPTTTELNQLYANLNLDSMNTVVRGGRQRIILDDARFVGNVGWRQNEQTYDALTLNNKSIEGVEIKYAYLWEINRIFGDQFVTTPAGTRDFHSDSHLFNATVDLGSVGKLTAFTYLLDFSGRNSTARANSSKTYGARLTGKCDASDTVSVGYNISYAQQVDNDKNTTNYEADYMYVQADLICKDFGTIFVGYELLGSDSGLAQFRTPLATAHKFNGWADSFLDNGGITGLQDLFVGAAPKLPHGLKGKAVWHKFNKGEGGGDLGWEIDAVMSKKLAENLTGAVKYAYFDGHVDQDISRLWVMMTLSF